MIYDDTGRKLFPLGMYERPRTDDEWRTWSEAGINLVRCGSREDLDEAREWGMSGWVHVPETDDGAALGERIDSLKDHPALVVWEAPDEAILAAWRNRSGSRDPAVIEETASAFDALVQNLARGAAFIRERDPGRKLWLNEAVISPTNVLARCAPFLDIVGFDYYPVPERTWRPMNLMGPETARFRDAAPSREVWIVQQAFKWSSIGEDPVDFGDEYPTREQYRFMAWQAILHGATGLLWWGSSHEDRPAPNGDRRTPFMDDLMSCIGEIAQLHAFLQAGPASSVAAHADTNLRSPILDVGCAARRAGDRTLVTLVNQDSHPLEVVITGLDWVDHGALRPIGGPYEDIVETRGGLRTMMAGHETRLYVSS